MFTSSGTLKIKTEDSPPTVCVDVDAELARYYRNQIPFQSNRTRYSPHITVIRNEEWDSSLWIPEIDECLIEFQYEPYVYWNDTYVWLAVECFDLELRRASFCLPPTSEQTYSPDKQHKFHITIGNMKGLK